jgi:hypothetical protein
MVNEQIMCWDGIELGSDSSGLFFVVASDVFSAIFWFLLFDLME